jgi:nitrile hydratase accessory protein
VARAEAVLGAVAPWPVLDGEPVFAEPWQGRAFAMTIDVVARAGLPWDDFRARLVAAIDEDPQRAYYESWVVALERLSLDVAAVTAADLEKARGRAAAYRYDEEGLGDVEVFPVQVDTDTLHAILTTVLAGPWWASVRYGPLIQGAAYELRLRRRPSLSMDDGYVTIDDGGGHVHVCIGAHTGSPEHPVSAHLAGRRRCRHAELYRTWLDGAPTSWGWRMYNGDDDQQLNVLLPNPFLDDEDAFLDVPDWSRLACWDDVRRRFLGLGADPADRLGRTFRHA